MQFEEYQKRVSAIIWEDWDGYTFDFDSLEKVLRFPFLNNISVSEIADRLLKKHKYIVRLAEEMEFCNKKTHIEIFNIVNYDGVINFNKSNSD